MKVYTEVNKSFGKIESLLNRLLYEIDLDYYNKYQNTATERRKIRKQIASILNEAIENGRISRKELEEFLWKNRELLQKVDRMERKLKSPFNGSSNYHSLHDQLQYLVELPNIYKDRFCLQNIESSVDTDTSSSGVPTQLESDFTQSTGESVDTQNESLSEDSDKKEVYKTFGSDSVDSEYLTVNSETKNPGKTVRKFFPVNEVVWTLRKAQKDHECNKCENTIPENSLYFELESQYSSSRVRNCGSCWIHNHPKVSIFLT